MVSLTVALGADKETAVKDMLDCLEFELKLLKVSEITKKLLKEYLIVIIRIKILVSFQLKSANDNTRLLEYVKVENLLKIHPKIDWVKLLNSLSNLRENYIGNNTSVPKSNVEIIIELNNLLENTPKRVQANYMYWKIFFDSILFMSDDHFKLISESSRSKLCVKKILEEFQLAACALYIRKYFDVNSREGVTKLINDIKRQFPKQITEV